MKQSARKLAAVLFLGLTFAGSANTARASEGFDATIFESSDSSDKRGRWCRDKAIGGKKIDYSNDSFGFAHEVLDENICYVDRNDKDLLLLRAELAIVVATRYAAASIERYSENRSEMSLRMITKVNRALEALDATYKILPVASGTPPATDRRYLNYFDVYRADLVMRMSELFVAATEPTRSQVGGFLTSSIDLSFGKKAFGVFQNLVVDELYANAYRDAFIAHVRGINQNALGAEDFNAIAKLLNDPGGGCRRLELMAGQGSLACRIPTF